MGALGCVRRGCAIARAARCVTVRGANKGAGPFELLVGDGLEHRLGTCMDAESAKDFACAFCGIRQSNFRPKGYAGFAMPRFGIGFRQDFPLRPELNLQIQHSVQSLFGLRYRFPDREET